MAEIFGKIKAGLPKIPVRGSVKFEGAVEQISVGAEVVELEQVG
jgi:hypothetical protein